MREYFTASVNGSPSRPGRSCFTWDAAQATTASLAMIQFKSGEFPPQILSIRLSQPRNNTYFVLWIESQSRNTYCTPTLFISQTGACSLICFDSFLRVHTSSDNISSQIHRSSYGPRLEARTSWKSFETPSGINVF